MIIPLKTKRYESGLKSISMVHEKKGKLLVAFTKEDEENKLVQKMFDEGWKVDENQIDINKWIDKATKND